MMKIVTVVGARPQFVKAATVSRALAKYADVKEILVHTGQHFDENMSDVFFSELSIPQPAYNLGIGGGGHGAMTGRQLEAIEQVLISEKPDCVLVYGDTNSTLAGALAAVKLHIQVAHVEAGLRSFNRRMPEEINRILTDHTAEAMFAPTQAARQNLLREGVDAAKVHVVGDVMYDAAIFYRCRARRPHWVTSLDIPLGEFALCTIHRAENTDDPKVLQEILQGLSCSKIPVILPLHPRTRRRIEDSGLVIAPIVRTFDPVGYLEMVWLEMHCAIVITDSGGVQKEAYFHGKPCVTMRDETEWVELVEHGFNRLVGARSRNIAEALNENRDSKAGTIADTQLYGDGTAADKIAGLLRSELKRYKTP